MIGILLALANPLLTSIQNGIAKTALRSDKFSDSAVVFARLFYMVPFFVLGLAWAGFPIEVGSHFWSLMAIMVTAEVASQILLHKAFKISPMADIMPIAALLGPMLLLTSKVLEPDVTWTLGQYLGIAIITGAVYLSEFQKSSFSNPLEPLAKILSATGPRFMLIVTLLWVVTTHLQQETVTAVHVESSGNELIDMLKKIAFMGSIYLAGASFGVWLVGKFFNKETSHSILAPQGCTRLVPIGIFAGCASIAQYGSLFFIEEAVMIGLKETLIIWAVIIDALFFGERPNSRQLLTVIAVTLGSLLMIFL
jgi:drug/metabolite transporter (DMT)-like permease